MKIGTLAVGQGEPCAVIAELGNAHNQDESRAYRLLDAAKAAGASAAKLQCYSVDELIALRGDGTPPPPWDTMTMRELYGRAMTPRAWFPRLYDYARSIELPLFSSVFGAESVALLESCGNPCYKVSHLDSHDMALATVVCATKKPVLVSVGRSVALPYFCAEYQLVDCTPSYPTAPADVHLGSMVDLWGLSSHCTHPLLAPLAVARGVHYYEVHFHLHDEPSALEAAVSVDEYQLHDLVQSVRQAEILLG